ncbi:hypothetical protein ACEPAF_1117 [Sanghuangporus sanghuang]
MQDWAPKNCDINIIKNVWDYLDDRLCECPFPLHNLDELWEVLQEEWYKISKSYIDKLYNSIPERVEEVIEMKGGNTTY